MSRAINMFWENSVKIDKWQWKLVNEQHGGVNVTDWILNGVYRKKNLWRFLRWIIHSFAAPCTYIIYLQPPQQLLHLCFMQQNRPYDQLPQRLVNTQPHFTLFHYNSLISLCRITVLQHDHTGRLYTVILPHHVHRKIGSWLEHYHFS